LQIFRDFDIVLGLCIYLSVGFRHESLGSDAHELLISNGGNFRKRNVISL